MKRLSLLLFALSAALCAEAQLVEVKEKVSGFLGKRLIVGTHGYFSLSGHPQRADDDRNTFTFNRSFHIAAQYTLSNSKSLGLSFGNSNTSCELTDNSFNSNVEYISIIGTDGNEYFFRDIKGRPEIKDRTICLELRNFLKGRGAVSPFGSYISLGLNFHNYEIDASNISLIVNQEIDFYTNTQTELVVHNPISKKTVPEFYLGYGIARPIWNSVFLDVGIKSGLLLTSWYSISGESSSTFDEEFEMEMYRRLATREIVNFKIGIQIPIL